MAEQIVNVTQHLLVREIETVLEQYPDYPYQKAFAHPDFRQRLIVHLLNQCQNHFALYDTSESAGNAASTVQQFYQDQPNLHPIIHQGIHALINENADWINRHIPNLPDKFPFN